MKPPAPNAKNAQTVEAPEPRWLAAVALLAAGGLFTVLPEAFSPGPSWLLIVLVGVLLVPTLIAHRRGKHEVNQTLGLIIAGVVTVALVAAVVRMVLLLPQGQMHGLNPNVLLRTAVVLWLTNVLVFALWYWRLDAGGPHERDKRVGHERGAFLFPQMTLDADTKALTGQANWSPGFIDYLFLAFNTSTALSPTDTAALNRWAKALMMVQSILSLTIIALLAARAVNIL